MSARHSRDSDSCDTTDSVLALQVGLGYSMGMGTGLVVARHEEDDSWSAPSAIAALSCGWGLQVP